MKKTLGLYLHIPFCRSKCLYCDFCSIPTRNAERMNAYVDRLCDDLAARADDCRDYTVDTVYFGGGTPTALPRGSLERLLGVVAERYDLSPDAEITAECNPATADRGYFRSMRRAGFNRISVGLQSIHADELRALGRIHTYADFCRTVEDLTAAGFPNFSADVMIGIPLQTQDSFLQTLTELIKLRPRHISAYGLTIEEGTPFARTRDSLALPDDDTVAKTYLAGVRLLASEGFSQYEISNFARAGYESRHNLKYWNLDEYLGLGPAAASDFAGERRQNSRDLDAYLRGEEITEEASRPSPDERANEYVMLRMRLAEGISPAAFDDRFGGGFEERFGKCLRGEIARGFVRVTDAGNLAFTPEGMYVSNAILSEILDFSDKNEKTS